MIKIKEILNLSPQETAIAMNLSVKENLEFMAGVYQIKNPKEKIDELVKLYKIEENEEMKSLVLVQILKNMEKYICSYLSKEYKFLLSSEYKEDVVQECKIAVLESLEKFEPFNGIPFITYSYLPIKQKIHVFIEKNIFLKFY